MVADVVVNAVKYSPEGTPVLVAASAFAEAADAGPHPEDTPGGRLTAVLGLPAAAGRPPTASGPSTTARTG
ncbi:hypothetical protein [Streptomyces sp. NPDC048187]|uniref:hypothetical protein n=1 Tax=Streptomyces sp. NPDC048187 TaxID=3365509 RepID=UPI003723A462